MTYVLRASRGALALLAFALLPSPARSQDVPLGQAPAAEQALSPGTDFAQVTVDGHELFPVRGIRAYPAERRAGEIASRIREAASDPSLNTSDMRLEETADGIGVLIGDHYLFTVLELDADLENMNPGQLAQVYSGLIAEAIDDWRAARDPSRLARNAAFVVVGAILLIGLLFLLHRLYLALARFVERRGTSKISVGSLQVLRPEQLRALLLWMVRVAMTLAGLVAVYAYLNAALGAFPWTRGFAESLLGHVTDPILSIGRGILGAIPGLLFIVIAWFFIRFVLRLVRTYFTGLEHGTFALRGFDPDWARPTYRLVRTFIIVLFLVMIFPYIPGSSTGAFKGISLFMGIVFSLGSSSVIGNLIAGYTMTYRRAFRVGDRILVDGSIGDVEEMRLLVTHLRSPKNEEIIVPNTLILNGNVTNYSSIARKEGLILHTTVGIGYETPWRQVEAMLVEAARRTEGLESEPPPFVLQKELADFAVTYEVNAYTRDPRRMYATYTALHANILDVFNEYGVQIMTPAYEGDPEVPKVVPPDGRFAAPASESDGQQGGQSPTGGG
ncbi:MAG: mechanosensitive ion channel family protein [Gemmatimonadota bacterium]|jgi:small-conductance mechanosensitive channel